MRGEPLQIINISHTINCSHTGHRDACELAIDFQGYITVASREHGHTTKDPVSPALPKQVALNIKFTVRRVDVESIESTGSVDRKLSTHKAKLLLHTYTSCLMVGHR